MDNILDRVIQNYHFFTRSESKVADYILKAKQEIQSMTISELAANCGVAEATVTRFCRSLGCKGFHDFKMAVALAVLSPEGGSASERYGMCGEVHAEDSIEEKCRKLCYIGTEALQQTCTLIEPEQIRVAVDCLFQARCVYCFGQGNSSITAMEAWGRFSSVTHKFHWISDVHMQAYTASLLGPQDVVLYFSFSGATRELSEIGELLRQNGARMILITRFPNSPGASYASPILICGANEGPLQQGSLSAKIAQLYLIDVLFNEYCSRDLERTIENRAKTSNSLRSKLL